MIPLTNEQQESLREIKIYYICQSSLIINSIMTKVFVKLKRIVIMLVNTEVINIVSKYRLPKEILVIFYNGSNYDYYFSIKEPAKEFKGEFICLEEKAKKYKTFSVPITKEVKRIHKNGEEIAQTIFQITIY